MAENTKDLEVQTRDAVLSLIKKVAEESLAKHPDNALNARNVAEAYALATGQAVPDAEA